MATSPARRRGPRASGDARNDILAAARAEFAEKGYAGTSLRGVARVADVDPALIHHYFDGKPELFAATMNLHVNIGELLDRVVSGPRELAGQRLIRTFLSVWSEPAQQEQLVGVVKTAISSGGDPARSPVRQFVLPELIGRVCGALGVDDVATRAGLVGSQMIGLIIVRYLLQVPSMVAMSDDDIVAMLGPTINRYLFE